MTDTVYEDDKRATDILSEFMAHGAALRPPRMGKQKGVNVKLTAAAHQGLKDIAEQLGYVRGTHPNVSMLLEAIGTRTIEVRQFPRQVRQL